MVQLNVQRVDKHSPASKLLVRVTTCKHAMVKQHAIETDVPMLYAGCCQDSTAALKFYQELHTESVPLQRIQMLAHKHSSEATAS